MQFASRLFFAERFLDGELGHVFDDPLKVVVAYGIDVGIGRRVEEVDGVRDALFDGKFHRVQVITESLAKRDGVFHHPFVQRLLLHPSRSADDAAV